MAGAVVPVRRHRAMNGGTGKRLLSHQLSPLGLVPLFTGGWRAKEREVGRKWVQESTRVKYDIGERWERRGRRVCYKLTTVSHPQRNVNGRLQTTVLSPSPDKEHMTEEAAPPQFIGFGISGDGGDGVPPGIIDMQS